MLFHAQKLVAHWAVESNFGPDRETSLGKFKGPVLAQSGSSLMRGIAAGVGSKADIDAATLPQLSFTSTPPGALSETPD